MRHLPALTLLAASFLLAFHPSAGAAPRSAEDCERIKGDLAYNQCLAGFGPRMGERASRTAAPADEVAEEASTVRRSARRAARTVRRGGRQAASFDIVTGTREARRSRRR